MSRAIEIIDPDGERRTSRRRRVLIAGCLASLAIFAYPEARDFFPKWRSLKAGREFGLYLSMLKTRAIINRSPIEARFKAPDLIEIFEVSSCGPFAERTKLWTAKLSDFEPHIEFAPEPWVRVNSGSREPYLLRYCYDPIFGSSIFADGLIRGGIFLASHSDIEGKRGDHIVQVLIEGPSADINIE